MEIILSTAISSKLKDFYILLILHPLTHISGMHKIILIEKFLKQEEMFFFQTKDQNNIQKLVNPWK